MSGNYCAIPDSFCYTDSPKKLGVNLYERLENAIDQATMWLFSHQIWVETRKLQKEGIWIAPEAERFPDYVFPEFLNPQGYCRCGKKEKYKNCHFQSDFESMVHRNTLLMNVNVNEVRTRLLISINQWQQRIGKPQRQFIQNFEKILSK